MYVSNIFLYLNFFLFRNHFTTKKLCVSNIWYLIKNIEGFKRWLELITFCKEKIWIITVNEAIAKHYRSRFVLFLCVIFKFLPHFLENSRIRDTLNLSTCSDSSTNTKMTNENVSSVRFHMSCVMCHVSCIMCHMSRVTCHLSLTPTVTSTYPPPAISPIMHSRLVHKYPQSRILLSTKNNRNTKNKKSREVFQY